MLYTSIFCFLLPVACFGKKGTGALRAALWKYFKTDKRIKSYRHAEYGDGDAGVTIVEFKI